MAARRRELEVLHPEFGPWLVEHGRLHARRILRSRVRDGKCWGGRIRTYDWLIQSQLIESSAPHASFRAISMISWRAAGPAPPGIR